MTIQVTENLIFNGEEMELQVSSAPKLPKKHSRIIKTGDGYTHTACWRCYVGTWEVKEEKLFLAKLRGNFAIVDETPIFADWFSGTLLAPQGEIIHHPGHIGECLHESDLRITIENGNVVRTETVDNQDKLEEILENQRNAINLLDIPKFLRRRAD